MSELELSQDLVEKEGKSLERYIEQNWTLIPVNYLHNRLMGRSHFIELIRRISIDYDLPREQREELVGYFNNGGEGLDLTFQESNLLYGIAHIFTKYGYTNEVECTFGQIYKAAGYRSNLSGWLRQRLKGMLRNLSEKRFPFFWAERNDRWKYITFESLISMDTISSSTCTIKLNEKLVGRLYHNYRMADPDIFRRIREYKKSKGKNPSKYDIRLYDLLLLENTKYISRNYLVLAHAPMLMDHCIQSGKLGDIREKLNEIYRMYYDLGYLSNFYIGREGSRYEIDVLVLNEKKFYKLRRTKEI